MKIRIRFLVAAVMVWQIALAQAAVVTQRQQWNDALQTGRVPPSDSAVWQAADKEIHRGLETGTLWLRLRVQVQAHEDLYLALGNINVDDLAVGVQYPAPSQEAEVLPPAAMVPVEAQDVREGKFLLRGTDAGPREAIVWLRTRSTRARWLEADVLGPQAWMQQRARETAISAMQLSFAALLALTSLVLLREHRKKIFAWMAFLGLLSGLYRLQVGGAWIELLGQDLRTYVALNNSLVVALGCTCLYVAAAVLASPRFKLRHQRGYHGLLAASVLMTLLALYTSDSRLNVGAVVLLTLALLGFCGDSLRQWLQNRAWRQGLVNRVQSVVFLSVVLINLNVLLHIFAPGVHLPWVDALRALNLPLLSWGLMFTLLWRQQRTQFVNERRRHINLQKLQEQISIRFLQQQFIAMLVHEIKTHLTVVQLGTNALLKDGISSERKQAWSLRIHTAIKSMVHILDNCSQAERYEGGVMALKPIHFSVAERMELVKLQALDPLHDAPERLQLRFECPIEGLQLHTDPNYFQIICNNLVSNALKYSTPDSAVIVQISRMSDAQGLPQLQIAVRNTIGPWGSPDPEKIFSRYYRSEKAGSISGTGLGLWLSQKLAERLGTRIHLSLEAGQVVFWFTLPLLSGVPSAAVPPGYTRSVHTA